MSDFLSRLDKTIKEAVRVDPVLLAKQQMDAAKLTTRVERERLRDLKAKTREKNAQDRKNLGSGDEPSEVTVKLEAKQPSIISRIDQALKDLN